MHVIYKLFKYPTLLKFKPTKMFFHNLSGLKNALFTKKNMRDSKKNHFKHLC